MNVDGLDVNAAEYTFTRGGRDGRSTSICVANLMLLPIGTTAADMADVTQFCRNRRLRAYGAAELQILLDARLSEPQRATIYRELLDGNRDVIHEILHGGEL